MATHSGNWPTGTPCWVECAYEEEHRGLHHAKDFYGRLFGWHVLDGSSEYGDYSICLKDEQPAAAITTTSTENQPTIWTTYLAADDVDAFSARVQGAGGQVLVGPQDIGPSGRAAYCTDPTGAVFSLWQGREHPGFGITNEPGTVAWHTLLTRDLVAAKKFYADVFGYTYINETEYGAVAEIDGNPVCGIHLAEQLPDDVNASWLTHFGVVDRDSSAQLAQELEGYILMTFDGPMGPEAIIQAKHGEVFGLVQLPE